MEKEQILLGSTYVALSDPGVIWSLTLTNICFDISTLNFWIIWSNVYIGKQFHFLHFETLTVAESSPMAGEQLRVSLRGEGLPLPLTPCHWQFAKVGNEGGCREKLLKDGIQWKQRRECWTSWYKGGVHRGGKDLKRRSSLWSHTQRGRQTSNMKKTS